MEPRIDVTVITQPLKDAREALAAEVMELDRQATAIEDAARVEATEILKRGTEKAKPFRDKAATHRAHIARFELLIAKEEQEAREAGTVPPNGQPVAGQDPYRAPAVPGVAQQDGGDRG